MTTGLRLVSVSTELIVPTDLVSHHTLKHADVIQNFADNTQMEILSFVFFDMCILVQNIKVKIYFI